MRLLFIKKRTIIIIGIVIFIKLVLGVLAATEIVPSFSIFTDKATVILDAGHGGVDNGTSKGDLKEKDINLDIVLRTAEFLGNRGIAVGFTRNTDIDLGGALKKGRHRKDLQARAARLNEGLLGVSIHVNAAGGSKEGAMIFYQRDNDEAKIFAETVIGEVKKVQVLDHDVPIPRSNLFILKNTEVPTILLEVGFITHSNDLQKMASPQWRQEMAEAIGTGILKYLAAMGS
ncbi:MAG: N-acetylmuramoyl-L-alanine amidase [Bacillota bacterium]|nr:N-acetylmuramoyl-L-alanine amidase [Bacillota bacterium]